MSVEQRTPTNSPILTLERLLAESQAREAKLRDTLKLIESVGRLAYKKMDVPEAEPLLNGPAGGLFYDTSERLVGIVAIAAQALTTVKRVPDKE